MSEKQISVIIPGYNTTESLWRRCLSSVSLALSGLECCEILCVDDGSEQTNATMIDKLAREYTTEGCIIRVIHQLNQGPASSRNNALRIATGKYVTFVDSDDEVIDLVYCRCFDRLVETNADIAVYGVKTVWPDDGLMKEDIPLQRFNGREITPAEVKNLYSECLLNYPCNKVYKRRFLNEHSVRFPEGGMKSEDLIFNLCCLTAKATWVNVPQLGYVYYRTRSTLVSRYTKTAVEDELRASQAWYDYAESQSVPVNFFAEIAPEKSKEARDVAWRNMWLPGTPFSIIDRWKTRPGLEFFKMAANMFVRKHFYFRFIRRWHTRRIWPSVREI